MDGEYVVFPGKKFKHKSVAKLYKFREYVHDNNTYRDAQCLGCLKKMSKVKASYLVEHGSKCERLKYYNEEAVDELREEAREKEESSTRPGVITIERQNQEYNKIVDFISVNCLPLSTVESPEFKELFGEKNFKFKLPGRWKLTNKLLTSRANWFQKNSLSTLQSCPDRTITIEFDGWKSSNGMSILGIVATNLEGACTLLDLIDMTGFSETEELIRTTIINSLNSLEINPNKLNAFVTDEGSAYKSARETIIRQPGFQQVLQYRCMAHVLNLIGSSMSKSPVVYAVLTKLITFINKISHNKILTDELKRRGEKRVLHIVPTRWYSTSNAINSILAIQDSLGQVPHNEACGFSKWQGTFEDQKFWSDLKELSIYFNKLSSIIGISEASTSTLSSAFRNLLEFGKFLMREVDVQQQFRDAALSSYFTHFFRLDSRLVLSAYAFDPNFRCEYLKPRAIREVQIFTFAMLNQLQSHRHLKDEVQSEMANYQVLLTRDLPHVKDTYSWWQSSKFDKLKHVGKRLSACHSSSANTERMFSGLNRIISSSRNRLNMRTILELMIVRTAKLSARALERNQKPEQRSSQTVFSQTQEMPSVSSIDILQDEPDTFVDDNLESPDCQALVAMIDSNNENAPPLDSHTIGLLKDNFEKFIDFDIEVEPRQNTSGNLSISSDTSRQEGELIASMLYGSDSD